MLPMVRCILLLTSIMSSTLSPYSATALRLGTLFRRSNLPSSPSSLSSPSSPASRPSSPRLDAVTVPIVSPTTTGVTTHNQRQHPQHVKEQQLPPEDGTFSFVETLRELWTGPGLSKARQVRYDNMVRSSGGVWRSRLLGLFPHVVRKGDHVCFVVRIPYCISTLVENNEYRTIAVVLPFTVAVITLPIQLWGGDV